MTQAILRINWIIKQFYYPKLAKANPHGIAMGTCSRPYAYYKTTVTRHYLQYRVMMFYAIFNNISVIS